MASESPAKTETPDTTGPSWTPYRLTVRQFLAMIVAGIFPDDARIELLDGRLVDQMTRYAPHNYAVGEIASAFRLCLPDAWLVREEKHVILGPSWRPEPDLAIVRGPKGLYRTRDPQAADVRLLVEVADSSYATDRGEKWRAYAAARVPIYWIVNLSRSQVEVYRNPGGRGKNASYREAAIFDARAEVTVVVDGQEVGRIAIRDILP